jgi:hypothetical protein
MLPQLVEGKAINEKQKTFELSDPSEQILEERNIHFSKIMESLKLD